jgi:hypothetical protein
MSNKVYGGTREGHPQLCGTCRSGISIKAQRAGDDQTYCRAIGLNGRALRVTVLVVQCSAYEDARQPTRWDFEQTAWELTTSPSRTLGFLSPTERPMRPPR